MKRVMLVTGCSRGIGQDLALRAAAAGWTVVGTLRSEAGEARLRAAGVHVDFLDVRDRDSTEALVARVLQEHGGLDAVVANAGYGLFGCFEELPEQEIREIFEVNVFGAMHTVRAALPSLRERGGRVVLISSIAGRRSAPGSSVYAASKFAVEGWGEGLRHELRGMGVPVVLIEPGATETGFTSARRDGSQEAGPYAELTARLRAMHAGLKTNREPVGTVSEAVLRALEHPDPPLRIPTGSRTRLEAIALRLLPWRVYEALVQRALRRADPAQR